jgi:betaine reductase
MERPFVIVHYLNQFFGQIGGEDKAGVSCLCKPGPVGPGLAFKQLFGERAEIAATVICGDNHMAENLEQASRRVAAMVAEHRPDLMLAGPAFVSGRYGMSCGAVCRAVGMDLGIPVVTGMYEENPALDIYRRDAFIVPTGKSAAKMRDAAQNMADLAFCLLEGREPPKESYFTRGIRKTVSLEATGAVRAVDMLVASLENRAVTTELPLPSFEKVDPAPPVEDLRKTLIVLGTEGGVIPIDNPDRIEMSMATKYGRYSVAGMATMDPSIFTVAHGGYDNAYTKADPNRLVPLDVMRELAEEGAVGQVGELFYTTAGNATSVENATRFGRDIARDIREQFKGQVGVVFTST